MLFNLWNLLSCISWQNCHPRAACKLKTVSIQINNIKIQLQFKERNSTIKTISVQIQIASNINILRLTLIKSPLNSSICISWWKLSEDGVWWALRGRQIQRSGATAEKALCHVFTRGTYWADGTTRRAKIETDPVNCVMFRYQSWPSKILFSSIGSWNWAHGVGGRAIANFQLNGQGASSCQGCEGRRRVG